MWVSLLRENEDPWVDITGGKSLAGQWQEELFRDPFLGLLQELGSSPSGGFLAGVSLWEEMAHQMIPKVIHPKASS